MDQKVIKERQSEKGINVKQAPIINFDELKNTILYKHLLENAYIKGDSSLNSSLIKSVNANNLLIDK